MKTSYFLPGKQLTDFKHIFQKGREGKNWSQLSTDGKYKNEIDFITSHKEENLKRKLKFIQITGLRKFTTDHRIIKIELVMKLATINSSFLEF